MANIGLSEAARLTGKPRSTIHRAMKSGRLSYTVGADGARLIDPAELERAFAINPQRNNGATDAWDSSLRPSNACSARLVAPEGGEGFRAPKQ
jgi:hypothetical protein